MHRVVPASAGDIVVAAAALEEIGAGIAGDEVGEIVAGAVDVGRAGKRQVLDRALGVDRIGKTEPDRQLNRVGAAAAALIDNVGNIIDNVKIVADVAVHIVGTKAAVDGVVAIAGKDDIVAAAALEHIGASIAGDQVG